MRSYSLSLYRRGRTFFNFWLSEVNLSLLQVLSRFIPALRAPWVTTGSSTVTSGVLVRVSVSLSRRSSLQVPLAPDGLQHRNSRRDRHRCTSLVSRRTTGWGHLRTGNGLSRCRGHLYLSNNVHRPPLTRVLCVFHFYRMSDLSRIGGDLRAKSFGLYF